MLLRRTMPLANSAGCAVLSEPEYALRPYSPATPQLLYYELTVLDAGAAGYGCIGFAHAGYDAAKVPGWYGNSVGYHGDDGKLFHERTVCHTGGLRTDLEARRRGGRRAGLGVPRRLLHTQRRQAAGLACRTLGMRVAAVGFGAGATCERVRLNFGDTPFQFKLEA